MENQKNPFDKTLEELSQRFQFPDEAARKAWINAMDHQKKGKHNKLKPGDVVMAKPRLVEWHATHLAWCYAAPAKKEDGYSEGEKEIRAEDIKTVLGWTHAHTTARMPLGIISHYGAHDGTEKGKDQEGLDRKCVYVTFVFKVGSLRIPYGTYVAEKDLWKKRVDKKTGKVIR